MEIHLGPVSSDSVTQWVAFATGVLTPESSDGLPGVDPEAVTEFLGYLETWDRHARDNPGTFVWVGSVDPERLEYLAHSFARIVDHLAAVASHHGRVLAPPEGDDFYQTLVRTIIEALQLEGDAASEFSEQLRDNWPGLRRD